jgi:hypothetical protein
MHVLSCEGSNAITIYDPNNRCIRVNSELYASVQNKNEPSTRAPNKQK